MAATWSGPVLELWFWPAEHVWSELRDLVAAEQARCNPAGSDRARVLVWSLHRSHGRPVVRVESVTGWPDYLASIAHLVQARPGSAVGPARRQEVWTSAAG